MPGNSICITKVATLLSSLQDMLNDEVSSNQSSSTTTNSLWEDILVVVTIITI